MNNFSARTRSILLALGCSTFSVIILLLHANRYMPFLSDDALITLRYADRLLDGKGLTWTEGIPVEGYSNLLWLLANAFMGLLGIDLILSTRILGLACMAAITVTLVSHYGRSANAGRDWIPILLGLLFFNLSSTTAIWAIGGLEQPLFILLLALAIHALINILEKPDYQSKATWLSSLFLGLMCLTRPDGPLFSVAAFLAILWHCWRLGRRPLLKSAFLLPILPIAFYGSQLIFRLFYYGELVPNTALVKITPSFHHALNGLRYLFLGLQSLSPLSYLSMASLVFCFFTPKCKGHAFLFSLMAALWAFYLVFIGGDIFPGYRHFTPLIVIFTYALIEGFRCLFSLDLFHKYSSRLIASSVVFLLFIPFLSSQWKHPEFRRAITERWEWDCKVLALVLRRAFAAEQPLIAVTAAGCLPYWSELPAIDMYGLNDYYIARFPLGKRGRGHLAHEVSNAPYILRRKPDIISLPKGPIDYMSEPGRQLNAQREFHDNYKPVTLWGNDPYNYTETVWIRTHSSIIGLKESSQTVDIPGYLLNANPKTLAYLNKENRLVVAVSANHPVGIRLKTPPDPNWTVHVDSSNNVAVQHRLKSTNGMTELWLHTESKQAIEVKRVTITKANRVL